MWRWSDQSAGILTAVSPLPSLLPCLRKEVGKAWVLTGSSLPWSVYNLGERKDFSEKCLPPASGTLFIASLAIVYPLLGSES